MLTLSGDFDAANVPRVRRTLTELIDATAGPIVVDLEQVNSLHSGALGVLVAADHRLQARGDRLRVARPRPEVLDAMRAAGIHQVLRTHDTVEEACADLP